MVKYKSLLENICCRAVDGKENILTVINSEPKIMSEPQKTNEPMKIQEDQYIPSWRAACDAWVTDHVVDCTGVHTPVYILYNAYIKANPDNYMDIGQFGKVLRSRFPYRKRRRGKQGQQVYVYQDVALKNQQDPAEEARPYLSNNDDPKQSDPSQQVPVAGPAIVVGNNTGGRMLSSPPQTLRDELSALNSSSIKRKSSESDLQQSLSHKRLKNSDNTEFKDAPSNNAVQQNTESNQQTTEHEPSNVTSGDEKYANSSLCRMAIGRRWIDANLMELVGTHTYANDICKAYAEDEPNEPMNYTSLALLIRGKYPGRRRKVNIGGEARYLYQDIKLIRNQVERAQDNPPSTSCQELRNLQQNVSPFSKEVTNKSTNSANKSTKGKVSEREMSSFSHALVAPEMGKDPSAVTSRTSKSVLPYYLIPFPAGANYKNFPIKAINTPVVTNPIPSTLQVFTKELDLQPQQHTLKNSPSYQGYNSKATSSDNRGKRLSFANQEERITGKDSRGNAKEDMNVSEYIESELLAINEINNSELNYKFSIGKAVTIPESIVNLNEENSRRPVGVAACETKSEPEILKQSSYKFKKNLMARSNNNITGTTSAGTSKQDMNLFSERLPEVDKEVTPVTNEKGLDIKRSWDYGMRKCISPESATSLVQKEVFSTNKKIKAEKKEINKKKKFYKTTINSQMKINGLNTSNTKNSLESPNYNLQEVTEKLVNTPRSNEECTNSISNGSGASPTSTSPPGPAMHRLAEEIVTSTPYVKATSPHISPCSSPSITVQEPRTNVNSSNVHDPLFKDKVKSVILTTRQTLSRPAQSVNESVLREKLERAVIGGKNPAVLYNESTIPDTGASNRDLYPCSVTTNLKTLVLSSPEHVNNLLRHHQSCPGLGCSLECQTLRAAYVHITIFHHKCQVWDAFYKIISKHSKPCRVVSCGVEFCQFMKHELHLNGVSVLPMQLLKERPTLEKEFKICEEIGTHIGDLHCRHMQSPILPAPKSSVAQRKIDSRQQPKQITMDSFNFIFPNTSIGNIFPDTPTGNTMAVPVLKTLGLVKGLFTKRMDPT